MKSKLGLLFVLVLAASLFSLGADGACPGSAACGGSTVRGWSGPVVVDNDLYLATVEGEVVAYTLLEDPRPGVMGWWPEPFEPDERSRQAFYGTPAVANGVLYIGSYGGKFYAIDTESGMLIWEYPQKGDIGRIVGGPVVVGGIVYIGSADGEVYALDADTGMEVWPQPFDAGDEIWATPAVSGGVVYIGCFDKSLYAVNAETGEKLWEFETGGVIAATPLIYDDTIYIGSFDSKFYAIDLEGNERWAFEADNWFWAKAVVYDDLIIAGCVDGKVYALNASDGTKGWERELEGAIRADLALSGDLVIVGSDEDMVYVLQAATGNPGAPSSYQVDDHVRAPLFAEGEKVYVHTSAGTLYALDVEQGRVLWKEEVVE